MWRRATLICLCLIGLAGFQISEALAKTSPDTADGEIDALVAPVALFPDLLLAKVFIASTYPLEVDEASTWLRRNRQLSGPALDRALDGKPWDDSVEELVSVPAVLLMMGDRLEWTQNLGDAVLSRPELVIAAVQRVRSAGNKRGKLRSTGEQRILVENGNVIIKPAHSQLLYVPFYDPAAIFGEWPYPLDTWIQSPGYGLGTNIDFSQGVNIPASFSHDGIDWRAKRIFETKEVDPKAPRGPIEDPVWEHDPRHRHGVNYPTPALRERYGGGVAPGVELRRNYRGFDPVMTAQAAEDQGDFHAGRSNPAVNEDAFYGFELGRRVRVLSARGNASLAVGAVKEQPHP